jgi:hypothetical protein
MDLMAFPLPELQCKALLPAVALGVIWAQATGGSLFLLNLKANKT